MGKKMRAALTALLAAVFVCSAAFMAWHLFQYWKIGGDRQEAEQIAGLDSAQPTLPSAPTAPPETPEAQPEPTAPPETPEPLPQEAAALADVDLEALRGVNGDVLGWIMIPDTELSYPVVQGTDNRYYLTHNWKKEPSSGGAVFLESTNSPDFTGFNTIIYAHRMNNDTMFGTLKYYDSQDFWQAHPSVYVVVGETARRYDIFAAWEVGVRDIVYRLDLEESDLEEEFIRTCVDSSQIDTGLRPGADDRVLTLSTCTGLGASPNRWIVQGYLAQEYPLDPAGEGSGAP